MTERKILAVKKMREEHSSQYIDKKDRKGLLTSFRIEHEYISEEEASRRYSEKQPSNSDGQEWCVDWVRSEIDFQKKKAQKILDERGYTLGDFSIVDPLKPPDVHSCSAEYYASQILQFINQLEMELDQHDSARAELLEEFPDGPETVVEIMRHRVYLAVLDSLCLVRQQENLTIALHEREILAGRANLNTGGASKEVQLKAIAQVRKLKKEHGLSGRKAREIVGKEFGYSPGAVYSWIRKNK